MQAINIPMKMVFFIGIVNGILRFWFLWFAEKITRIIDSGIHEIMMRIALPKKKKGRPI
jgi:hypothetical protein